ncbi:MAG TPA: hypothetical protein VF213_01350, partial [Dongiaceae bacterium]
TDPPSAPTGNVPAVPPKPPPLPAGWRHVDALTWFDTLLHAHHGGSMLGALAPARPMSLRHDGMSPAAGQNQASIQQQSLLELLGMHPADGASTAVTEPPPKTRLPFPLGP